MEESWILADSFYDPARADFDIAESSKHVISNYAHLSLLKNQRNELRRLLTEERTSNAQRRHAVSNLRRLTLRLAAHAAANERKLEDKTQALNAQVQTTYVKDRANDARISEAEEAIATSTRQKNQIAAEWQEATQLLRQCTVAGARPSTPAQRHRAHLSDIPSPPSSAWSSPRSSRTGTLDSSSISFDIDTAEGAFEGDLYALKEQSRQAITACRLVIQSASSDRDTYSDAVSRLEASNEGLKDAADAYQAKIASLEHSKQELWTTIQSAETQLRELQEEHRSSKRREEAQKRDLGDRNSRIDALEQRAKASVRSEGELRSELISSRKALLQLERDYERVQVDLRMLQTCIVSHEVQFEQLRARECAARDGWSRTVKELECERGKGAQTEEHLSIKTQEVDKLQAEVEALNSQLDDASMDQATLRQKRDAAIEELEQAQLFLKSRYDLMAQLEARLGDANEHVQQVQTARSGAEEQTKAIMKEKAEVETELVHTKQQYNKLKYELDLVSLERAKVFEQLEVLQEDARRNQVLVEQLEHAAHESLGDRMALEQLLASAKKEAARCADLEAKAGILTVEKSTLRASMLLLKAEISKLKTQQQDHGRTESHLQARVQSLGDELRAAQESSATLESSRETLRGIIVELENERASLKSQVLSLQDDMNALKITCEELRIAKDDAERREVELRTSLAAATSELVASQQAREQLQELNSDLNRDYGVLETDFKDLRGRLADAARDMEAMSTSHTALKSDKASLEMNVRHLRTEVDTARFEKASAVAQRDDLENAKNASDLQKSALQHQLDEARSEMQNAIQSLRRRLEAADQEVDQLQKMKAGLCSRNEHFEQDKEADAAKIQSLERELQASRSTAESIAELKDGLEQQLAELNVAHDQLNADNAANIEKWQRAEATNVELRAQIRGLNDELAQARDLRQRLETSIEQLQLDLDNSKVRAEEFTKLLEDTTNEKDELRAKLDQSRKKHSDLTVRVKSLEAVQADSETRHAELTSTRHALEQELCGVRGQLQAAIADLRRTDGSYRETEQTLKAIRQEKLDLKQQLRTVRNDNETLIKQMRDATTGSAETKLQYKASIQELQSKHQAIEDLREQLKLARASESQVKAELQGRAHEAHTVANQLRDLQNHSADVKAELRSALERLSEVQAENQGLQHNLKQAKRSKFNLEEEFDQVRQKLQVAQERSMSLEQELRQSHDLKDNLASQLERTEGTLSQSHTEYQALAKEKHTLGAELVSVQQELARCKGDLESAKADILALKRSNDNLKDTHRDLKTRLQESETRADSLSAENEGNAKELTSTRLEFDSAQTAVARAEASLGAYIKQANGQIEERDQKLSRLQFELTTALSELEDERAAKQDLKSALEKQKAVVDDWEVRYTSLSHDLESSNHMRAESEAQRTALLARNEELKTQVHNLQSRLRNISRTASELTTPTRAISPSRPMSPSHFSFSRPYLSPLSENPRGTPTPSYMTSSRDPVTPTRPPLRPVSRTMDVSSRNIQTPSRPPLRPSAGTANRRSRPKSEVFPAASYVSTAAIDGTTSVPRRGLAHSAADTAWQSAQEKKRESGFSRFRHSLARRLR